MRNLDQISKDKSLQLINQDQLAKVKGGGADTTDTMIQPDLIGV